MSQISIDVGKLANFDLSRRGGDGGERDLNNQERNPIPVVVAARKHELSIHKRATAGCI